jgi:site-specific recombinase XerD
MRSTTEIQPAITEILNTHIECFLKLLERQNYAPDGVTGYRRRLSEFCAKVVARGVALDQLDENRAVELFTGPPSVATYTRFMIRRFIRYLIEQGIASPPAAASGPCIRQEYERYLRSRRGLSQATIYGASRIADRFLEFRFGSEVGDLSTTTANDIVAFMQELRGKKPLRDKTLCAHLRNFFRYLFQTGHTNANLSVGIPSVAQRYGTRLPRHLSTEDIGRLLEAVRAETTTGRRNHAMVLLMARLGLRAEEVINIQIDDIDWRAGEILVRGQGKRFDRLPLPTYVGEAMVAYISQDRKSSSTRALFVTKRPPHCAFKDGQVLNNILRRAYRTTGLKPPTPYVGSHILRHSLAVALVRKGASLEEIGDMLRHRSRATTMLYAKLDVDGLRTIAPPWPGLGGAR